MTQSARCAFPRHWVTGPSIRISRGHGQLWPKPSLTCCVCGVCVCELCAREPKRGHFRARALKKTTKIQRKDPKEREERKKMVAEEGKKRAKFWAVRRRGGSGGGGVRRRGVRPNLGRTDENLEHTPPTHPTSHSHITHHTTHLTQHKTTQDNTTQHKTTQHTKNRSGFYTC